VEKCGTAIQATDDNITRRMRFACWITKVTDTHLEYAILITYVLQQWLLESAWLCVYKQGLSSYNSFFSMCRKLHPTKYASYLSFTYSLFLSSYMFQLIHLQGDYFEYYVELLKSVN